MGAEPPVEALRVFLSYARADEEVVQRVRALLGIFEVDVWLDTEDLRGGDDWRRRIREELAGCDAVVVCISPRSVASKGFFLEEVEIARELAAASDGGLQLLPLLLDKAALPDGLDHLHWVDYRSPIGPDRLLEALQNLATARGRRPIVEARARITSAPGERSAFAPATGEVRYVGYPRLLVRRPGERAHGFDRPADLLWGDPVTVTGEADGRPVLEARGERYEAMEPRFGAAPPLTIDFLELGGGCGALVCTPGGRKVLVNAGFGDYMCRYLQWRWGGPGETVDLDAVLVTHGFQSHCGGLGPLFASGCFTARAVYHNGLFGSAAEWRERRTPDGRHVETLRTKEAFQKWHDGAAKPDALARVLAAGLEGGRVGDVRMLSSSSAYVPGFSPDDGDVVLEVLGPVDGAEGLRRFRNRDETLRAHCLVLRLRYGERSILLGGHLNPEGEKLLLERHAGGALASDLAKLCFHGTRNFTEEFLDHLHPAGCIAAMGPETPRVEPYDDATVALGARLRPRALIATGQTNLAFDADELPPRHGSGPEVLRGLRLLLELYEKRSPWPAARLPTAARERYRDALDRFGAHLLREHVVQLRTDGERALFARRIAPGNDWRLTEFEPHGDRLRYKPEPPGPRVVWR